MAQLVWRRLDQARQVTSYVAFDLGTPPLTQGLLSGKARITEYFVPQTTPSIAVVDNAVTARSVHTGVRPAGIAISLVVTKRCSTLPLETAVSGRVVRGGRGRARLDLELHLELFRCSDLLSETHTFTTVNCSCVRFIHAYTFMRMFAYIR